MFVVILSSSLAVFDVFMLVLFVLRQGRGRHSTQSMCLWHFHTLCIWLLFCEVLHQKPRKTTSRLPSCPLSLISSFEVQEFLGAWGYPVVHRLEVGTFYNFTSFLRNYMAALREARWSSSGWLLIMIVFLHGMCRIRHSTGARGGEWWRKREDRKDTLIVLRNLATFEIFWDILRHVVSRPWIHFTIFYQF